MFSYCLSSDSTTSHGKLPSLVELRGIPQVKARRGSHTRLPSLQTASSSDAASSSSSSYLANSSNAHSHIPTSTTRGSGFNARINTAPPAVSHEGKGGPSIRSGSTSLNIPKSIDTQTTTGRSSTLAVPTSAPAGDLKGRVSSISSRTLHEGKAVLPVGRGSIPSSFDMPNSINIHTSDSETKRDAFPSTSLESKLGKSSSLVASRTLKSLAYFRQLQRDYSRGYGPLAEWLIHRILVTPKGKTFRFCKFERQIVDALTDNEINHLKHHPGVLACLSVQENARRNFSIRILRSLAKHEEGENEQKYQFLARFIGAGESSLDPIDLYEVIRNSYAARDEWGEILKDPHVLKMVAQQADLIEELDLRVPFAKCLIDKAIELDPDKGLALLCRSCSNVTWIYDDRYPFDDQIVSGIARRFVTHLIDSSKPPMRIAFYRSLWKPVHNYLKSHPVDNRDVAMEWFIASMNMGAFFCLYNVLETSGYTLDDLTVDIRNKITCLKLVNRSQNLGAPFISTFKNLQELSIKNDEIEELPDNCLKLKRLTAHARNLRRLPREMPELVYLSIICSNVVLPENLPKVERFFCMDGVYKILPSMPRATTIELYGASIAALTFSSTVRHVVVHNNPILKEIAEMPQAEIIALENCPELTRFLVSSDSAKRLPGPRELPASLVYFHANGESKNADNSPIKNLSYAWNKEKMEMTPEEKLQLNSAPIVVQECGELDERISLQ